MLYRRSIRGWSSEVDGDSFFASPKGKRDPEAELEATIRAFYEPDDPTKQDEHALCRYPARRLFLEERLGLPGLASPRCPALDNYVTNLGAASISLVYASNYLDNPASAFGHTLLRVKKADSSDKDDIGVDYTAETDTTNPLLYAVKGIGGFFPGLFRLKPWAEMLHEYAGAESRDLWEYELALSPRELRMLVFHLRELSLSRIDYLYLSENCSYQIVAAIDASATRLSLVKQLKFEVIPGDTVKAVVNTPGLVRNVSYRPSVRSVFLASVEDLSAAEKDVVATLAAEPDAEIPSAIAKERVTRVIDAAIYAVDARYAKPMLGGYGPGAIEARRRLVLRRAALAGGTGEPPPPPMLDQPTDKRPDKSHGSMRFMLGTGMTSQYGNPFATLGFRLNLHDLLDPPDGQPELSQLQFFDVTARYEYERRDFTIDRFTFAEVAQLHPWSRFEKRLSWRARGFGMRLHDRACPDCFTHGANVSVGAAFGTSNEHFVVFAMADTYVSFAAGMDGLAGSVVRIGVGPYGGVRLRMPGPLVALVTGNLAYLPGSDLTATWDVRASLRATLGRNIAMGIETAGQPKSFEGVLSTFLYY